MNQFATCQLLKDIVKMLESFDGIITQSLVAAIRSDILAAVEMKIILKLRTSALQNVKLVRERSFRIML